MLYNALLNPSAIKEWWEASTAIVVKENGGTYAVSWGNDIDDPDYVSLSIIRNLKPYEGFSLEYISYYSKMGKLPFEAKMNVDFFISSVSDSNQKLEVKQTGFPDNKIANEYYIGCKVGWETVLNNIKKYCEQ